MTMNVGFRYDPMAPGFGVEIWDVYRVLRDEWPVYYDQARDEYALSRFDDVLRAAHDHATFSSVVAEAGLLLPMLNFIDQPRHTALRALVSRAFTPRRVAQLEDHIRQVARDLIDQIVRRDERECEFHHEFAAILPSVVIASMIGVPDEHVADFREWSAAFIAVDPEGFAEPAAKVYGLFAELLAERRGAPSSDLMTALIQAEVDGEKLSDDDLLGFCFLLMVGGIDTTTNLLGSGIILLATHPDQRALLLADPSRWPGAIEEINRIESPTQSLPRTALRDVELQGVTIPNGARVSLLWGAANHDEREFPEPERFDVIRSFARHLAFGHGIHYCLGANLARLEARVAFEEWHAAFPAYELAAEPTRLASRVARGHTRIPLRLG
jgi:cytochrome P450